jgi:hypothetical protein
MKLTDGHGREESLPEKSAKPVAVRCSAGFALVRSVVGVLMGKSLRAAAKEG